MRRLSVPVEPVLLQRLENLRQAENVSRGYGRRPVPMSEVVHRALVVGVYKLLGEVSK